MQTPKKMHKTAIFDSIKKAFLCPDALVKCKLKSQSSLTDLAVSI